MLESGAVDVEGFVGCAYEQEFGGVVPEDALRKNGEETADDAVELVFGEEAQGDELDEVTTGIQAWSGPVIDVGGVKEGHAGAGDFAEFE